MTSPAWPQMSPPSRSSGRCTACPVVTDPNIPVPREPATTRIRRSWLGHGRGALGGRDQARVLPETKATTLPWCSTYTATWRFLWLVPAEHRRDHEADSADVLTALISKRSLTQR